MSTLCCSRRLRLPRRFQWKASGSAATPVWQRIRAVRPEAFTPIELLKTVDWILLKNPLFSENTHNRGKMLKNLRTQMAHTRFC